MKTIPNKERPEWAKLVQGELKVPLKNFFFQMKVTQLNSLLNKNQISLDEAVEDAYNLCVKFYNAKNMTDDIKSIFGTTDDISKTSENKPNIVNSAEKISDVLDTPTKKIIDKSPEIKHSSVVFDKEYEERMAEILRQKKEIEERLNKQIKAREEAEHRAKLEKKRRLMELERMNRLNNSKKEIYKPKEITFEKKETNTSPVKTNTNLVTEEAKKKEVMRQQEVKKVRVKKKVHNKNFFQRWFNL